VSPFGGRLQWSCSASSPECGQTHVWPIHPVLDA